MKTALLFSLLLAHPASALEVHEWGTFTALTGSRDGIVTWYQPHSDLAGLPEFVGKNTVFKSTPSKVRMETPVLYFYPDAPGPVKVEASFHGGQITETFPIAVHDNRLNSGIASWTGNLIHPTDEEALKRIPAVPDLPALKHYEAAREVPEAWIFHSDLKTDRLRAPGPLGPQVEKFIFYRGFGERFPGPEVSVHPGHRIIATNYGDFPIETAVALRVEAGRATWKPLGLLRANDGMSKVIATDSQYLHELDRTLEEAENELVAFWQNALTRAGLSEAEAAAMLATWRDTWFREPGMRIFTLVPQKWVDERLPLTITPEPREVRRVFVSRLEILTPEKENILVSLLNGGGEVSPAELAAYEALQLGRFAQGAGEIAAGIQTRHMKQQHGRLRYQLEKSKLPKQDGAR